MTYDYTFTEKERAFFERHKTQFETAVLSGIQLISLQNDLPGQWAVNSDGTGLRRVDLPPQPPPVFELVEKEKPADAVA